MVWIYDIANIILLVITENRVINVADIMFLLADIMILVLVGMFPVVADIFRVVADIMLP